MPVSYTLTKKKKKIQTNSNIQLPNSKIYIIKIVIHLDLSSGI